MPLSFHCLKIIFLIILLSNYCSFGQEILHLEPKTKPLLNDLHYGARVGGLIAQEAVNKEIIVLNKNDKLEKIQVFTNNKSALVAGFKFLVKTQNGVLKWKIFGDTLGNPKPILNLKNKKIIGISGTYGWFIDSLKFHFSDGSTSPKYGGNGGDLSFQQIFNRNKNNAFKGNWCGIYGSYSDQLETIGLIFWAVE